MTPTISSLLSRVRAASGPDRELDIDIWQALCWQDHWREIAKGTPFTASIDAAVALVERVLPDANTVGIEKNPKGAIACVARNYVHSGHWMTEVDAATPPLAILAALLTALEQKESADG